MQVALPDLGKATSIYVREVTTIEEDFFFFFGYAFVGLFSDISESSGVTKELRVSKIVENHIPNSEQELSALSLSVYFR